MVLWSRCYGAVLYRILVWMAFILQILVVIANTSRYKLSASFEVVCRVILPPTLSTMSDLLHFDGLAVGFNDRLCCKS